MPAQRRGFTLMQLVLAIALIAIVLGITVSGLRETTRQSVYCLAFSPDGKNLAAGYSDGSLRLWGASTATLHAHNTIYSLAFSPDGKTLATGSGDCTAKLWDVMARSELDALTGHMNSVTSVAFSPDGRTLVTGSSDKTVKLWDVVTRQTKSTILADVITSVAFSPNGQILATGILDSKKRSTGTSEGTAKLWDVGTGKQRAVFPGPSQAHGSHGVGFVEFSPDGQTLAVGGGDTVTLWDLATGQERGNLQAAAERVSDVAFSPDGKLLATAYLEGTVRLWKMPTGGAFTLQVYKKNYFLRCVAFSPDSKTLAIGGDDGSIKLWDVARGQYQGTLYTENRTTQWSLLGDALLLWTIAWVKVRRRSPASRNPDSGKKHPIPAAPLGTDSVALLVACILASAPSHPLRAQDLLPGEMPVDFGREMIEPERFPTVRELMERLDRPEQAAALVFRFYGDQHNHYAPQWSADGRALAVLRSDIDAHTSKIVVMPSLDAERPIVLYPEKDSYDHMFAWSSSGGRTFAFASTNEPSELENLHLASLAGQPKPKRITSGAGVKANPALWTEGNLGRLFFSAAGKLESLAVDLEQPADSKTGQPVGEGTEAGWSPDGQSLVWTERTVLTATQSSYVLKLRDLVSQTDQRLVAMPGMMLRNPTWSPDSRHIAFYARPPSQLGWGLYVVPAPARLNFDRGPDRAAGDVAGGRGPNKAALVAEDVRVEEHFQNFGPSWDPRGDRLWFFSRSDEQEYYPLRWATINGKRRGDVGYPRRLTTGLDVAMNPNMNLRAIAFCAIENLRQDVIVMIVSHDPEP